MTDLTQEFFMTVITVQTLLIAMIFGGFLWVIVRGIDKILSYQKTIVQIGEQETDIKNREIQVIMTMIESEIHSNISKINAYIAIYKEMLSEIEKNPKTPRYKKLGDILQKQPGLERIIFDRNAGKIQVLGEQAASKLIHYYARIKTEPDYINIEPEEDVQTVKALLKDILDNAAKLKVSAEAVLESINVANISKH